MVTRRSLSKCHSDWVVDANTDDFNVRRSQQKEIQEVQEFLQRLLDEAT